MPTYEYKCQSCKRRFEVSQRMTEAPLTECAECHGPLKRLIGAGAGFLFKGNGFYATDYRSESYKQAAKLASSDATPAAASPTASTTATPAVSPATPSAPAAKSTPTEKKQP
jgi:putative FmdB family regulatory protein